MKAQQLREQTPDELEQSLREAGDELFDIKVKKNMGDSTTATSRIPLLRRDIARIKTVMRERKAEQDG